MSSAPREQWGSQFGFILAAVGSAVGLGNMWRFSYLTAENGGAAFLILYLAFVALVGLPVLLAELTLGRGARKSPIEALAHFGGGRWRPLGLLFVLSGFLIASYYSVIAGWTLHYGVAALFTGFPTEPSAYFGEISAGFDAALWHVAIMALTVATVFGGVKKGIERVAIVLMPILFLLVVGLALYAATLAGAREGYRFYLELDFASLLDLGVLNQAASQAFFSLSLGMGAMMTYASYLSRKSHLPNESLIIAGSDFAVAFIAGLAVFPMIFAFGLAEAVNESTVGALFITLPRAFLEMGAVGRVVGVLFFVALVIGAITSLVSLLEVVVASAMDRFGWERHRAALAVGVAMGILGIAPAFNTDLLGFMDQLAGNFFLIAGGVALAVFVGWIMRNPLAEVSKGAEGVRWYGLWVWLLRIPVPLVLLIVLFYVARDLLAGF